ncbi:hypothetical protein D9X30_1725 [Cupriavidus sp. U2]|uniref:NAD(P)-dependent oxidoreductase n=1 Tax=Cupriavidus sp. U2 TaxID=2920269 RepID=UPI00129EBBE5|nr:NAD(P)-dependent oxidoreductase [Cupriavidus sp. U2]KAI3593287.1 hypothetical protein D9X30_1725 [Cupriavidus sp. U2]
MNTALIGHSGYVGSTLLRQTEFDALYRSHNINEIRDKTFDLIVCAGAPAQKWIANREPQADRAKIQDLIDHLRTVSCKSFVLISTVDVFKDPVAVDENTLVEREGLHPYGLHRLVLEEFVSEHFSDYLIVRLPGLVGPGLRKNVVFDLLNENNLQSIDSRGMFQFYPMVNLWYDIQSALHAGLKLVHLTAQPIRVRELAAQGFGRDFQNEISSTAVQYDFRTRHAHVFGATGMYQYDTRATLQAVRAYAQSEQLTLKSEGSA